MSRPTVIETLVRRPSGKVDFHLSAGKEGKERVRVVLTSWGTFVCLTHVSADACVHADVAREYYNEHRDGLTSGERAA